MNHKEAKTWRPEGYDEIKAKFMGPSGELDELLVKSGLKLLSVGPYKGHKNVRIYIDAGEKEPSEKEHNIYVCEVNPELCRIVGSLHKYIYSQIIKSGKLSR